MYAMRQAGLSLLSTSFMHHAEYTDILLIMEADVQRNVIRARQYIHTSTDRDIWTQKYSVMSFGGDSTPYTHTARDMRCTAQCSVKRAR
jgi:hypothetical protein